MNAMGPDYYRDESTEDTLARTQETIAHIAKIDPKHELIAPIITPRFAPACSNDCLHALGKLQQETGLHVQTHIAENKPECALVAKLFPDSASYTAVYDDAGLLSAKTILAHAVHLSDAEIALIKSRDAKVSHCPSSNTALTSGTCKVRRMLDAGVDIGLGTDVSGGFSASVLEVARQAIWVSRFVAMTDGDHSKLSVEDVLYLATRGGAKVVGLEDQIGGFEVGKDWDAQLIVLNPVDQDADVHHEAEAPVDIFGWEKWEDQIHKWVYGGDDRNTAAVWVKGKLVHATSKFKP
jgi:guanine deaminase